MSRHHAIENALSAINGAVFQELCDSFLAIRNDNYLAFSRTGSQRGKQKTTTGTPDTFLLLPSGKYIFVEHSTNITKGVSKLEEDIRKCIDVAKTGIPLTQIAEIIICVNFKLDPAEIQQLLKLLSGTGITLTIYTLDSLAIELHLHHRNLAHEYLGLPLDTGQIVSIDRFISEYNHASKGIAAPLDNEFLHRESELKELKELLATNDFIILTGPPGVGKTKLALEAIKAFCEVNLSFQAYCVSYKHHNLLDDLYQYFDANKDFLLFVDDANRIDAFGQITGFFKAERKGKFKVIVTVRDYAYQHINNLSHVFLPRRLEIQKLSDQQIIDIIKSDSFKILNSDYQKEIVRIADGNPRLAIMAAALAKAKQNIRVLADVSGLFEKYFSTFVSDDKEFDNSLNIKCLGLIAFFYTIPYKNKEVTTSILDNFGIDYSDFADAIDRLDKRELIEIQFEHVKIPEQNLATYFFYRAFIKDNLLDFGILLNKYFEDNSQRFTDCIIPANNTFGSQNVMNKLRPQLKNSLQVLENKESLFKFLSSFWFYLQTETLEFIFSLVKQMPTSEILNYKVTYENNEFAYDKDTIIELLGNFFRFSNNLKDALELAFEYTRKEPSRLPELIHKIREQLTFDRHDEEWQFDRQATLFEVLLKGLEKGDRLLSAVFFELSKSFMAFKFQHTKGGRNYTIYWYDYPIPNNSSIQEFRRRIWSSLDKYFSRYPLESFDFLESYSTVNPDVTKEIMAFDVPFLTDIMNKHLSPDSFEHCRYIQKQIRWCERNSVTHPSFSTLSKKFTNETYEIFLKIDWDRLRDREMFEFPNHREYEKLKESEIRESFRFLSEQEVLRFFETFTFLKKSSKNEWSYNTSLDYIINENIDKQFELGYQLLATIIKHNNEINYVPRRAFHNHLNKPEHVHRIWILITSQPFNLRSQWQLSFFDFIDETLITHVHVQSLLNTIDNIGEDITIHFDSLKRFLRAEPNLFQAILKKICDKIDKERIRIVLWMDFFSDHFEELGNDINLIKRAYVQQMKIQNHFDYYGKGFLNIMKRDAEFLVEYITELYSAKKLDATTSHHDLGFIWEVEDVEPRLKEVFDLLAKKGGYSGILEHFGNCFFRNLSGTPKERATKFLFEYCKENNNDVQKMNIIVDIVRHSMRELFEPVLLLFLSLNQDVNVFQKILWRGNGGSYMGDIIFGDMEASEWKAIQAIVEKSDVGIKLLDIKKYVVDRIDSALRSADLEREQRYLERKY